MSDRMTAQQLKNSILQLAVQGKLVPQDPNDEPASVLLERIRKEKENLIKEGKIKKNKNESYIFRGSDNLHYEKVGNKEPVCIEDELPFEIPDSWEWTKLGNIGIWGAGATPPKDKSEYYKNGTIPWLLTGDLNDGYITQIPNKINILALKNTSVKINPEGSVLIAMYGATIGKLGILSTEATTNQACCACQVFSSIYNEYLFYFFMANKQNFIRQGEGGAQPNISKKKIINTLIPLPPLPEQKRIVDKIKKLEPLIDKYKVIEEQLFDLNSSFKDKLKKSILQYAIEGKLVPQVSNDEPASVLLEKIKEEKQKLILEGKIKKDKHEAIIYRRDNSYYEKIDGVEHCIDDEIPFDIPDSWEWCRLGCILTKLTDGSHNTPKYVKDGIPFLSVKDISSGKLNFDNVKYITKEEHETLYKRCDPKRGDILITKVGTTGIPVIVNTDMPFSLFVSVAQMRFLHQFVFDEYLLFILKSPLVQKQCKENTKGISNKNWVIRDIAKTFICIPPLEEQKRIINQLKKIYSILDN